GRGGGVGPFGSGCQGQRAADFRIRISPSASDPVHLPASGAGAGADRSPARGQGQRRGLRNDYRAGWIIAAVDADERGGRPHGGTGGGAVSRSAQWRTRHTTGGGCRRRSRGRGRGGRGRRGGESGQGGGGGRG